MASTMVAVGLTIAAAGFAGRYVLQAMKHMEPQVKQVFQSLPKSQHLLKIPLFPLLLYRITFVIKSKNYICVHLFLDFIISSICFSVMYHIP
uniref:Uncharacterized protein n=1 Tax=Saimiri boliviensis boliviensis TaxID=39432 RepID=A0A2K6V574_SAIBB